ncbi:hypothetical protein VNI00_015851 [Paramarasmius palmivorus]|uniref:Uncharacterized protein n=1 Tax=Paramarasmius palmivorus TaxID=297713 RepID=A0AAW0BI89_9AGAR
MRVPAPVPDSLGETHIHILQNFYDEQSSDLTQIEMVVNEIQTALAASRTRQSQLLDGFFSAQQEALQHLQQLADNINAHQLNMEEAFTAADNAAQNLVELVAVLRLRVDSVSSDESTKGKVSRSSSFSQP